MADKTVIVKVEYDTTEAVQSVNNLTVAQEKERQQQTKLKEDLKQGRISRERYSREVEESKQKSSKANAERRNTIKLLQSEKGSINELRNNIKRLRTERDKLNLSTKEGRKEFKNLNNQIKSQNENLKTLTKTGRGFTNSLKNMVLGAFGIVALVSGFKRLVSGIIETRKEFEKYEAVLTVALGSQREARIEMGKLQQFAAETPFQLKELTGAYVKLVNQGFKPTMDQMRLMGDLAASQGKSFDQLTEAIIDAQVGEFERLKEFGIRAQKSGDQVTFAFKGITETVDFTADSIQNYILGLGEAEGVSGSMSAISETLGGRISNLGDAWDSLLNNLGNKSSGIFATVIGWLSSLIKMLDAATKSTIQLKQEVLDKALSQNIQDGINEVEDFTDRLIQKGIDQETAAQRSLELHIKALNTSINTNKKQLETAAEDQKEFLQTKIDLLIGEREGIEDHYRLLELQQQKSFEIQQKAQIKAAEERAKIEEKANKLRIRAEKEAARQLKKELSEIEREKIEEDEVIFDEKFQAILDAGEKEMQALFELNEQKLLAEKELQEKLKELKTEAFIAVNQILTDQFNGFIDNNLAKFVDSQQAQEDALKNRLDKGLISEQEYEKQLKKIRLETRQAEAKAEKKKALFDIAVNTATAIVQALPNVILAGIVAGIGAVQAAVVAARPIPKFAKGGVIGGFSHEQGGTKFIGSDGSQFEAERGESLYVLKRDATAQIAALSAINESFGGRSLNEKSSHLQEGGQAQPINVEDQVDKALQRTPIYVKVGDIETGLTDYSNVKDVGVV